MFLRYLWRALKPKGRVPARKKQNSKLAQWREGLYCALTGFLSKSYQYYAVEDTIVINGGQVKVEHSLRDVEFERELERLGIFVKGKRSRIDMSHTFRRRGRGYLWRFFHFEDIVTIAVGSGKRSIVIKRGEVAQIASTIRGAATKSSDDALVSRLSFELSYAFDRTATHSSKGAKAAVRPAVQFGVDTNEGSDIQQPIQPQPDSKPAGTKHGQPPKSNFEPPRKPTFEPLPSEVAPESTTPTVEPPAVSVAEPEPIPPKKYTGLEEVDESF